MLRISQQVGAMYRRYVPRVSLLAIGLLFLCCNSVAAQQEVEQNIRYRSTNLSVSDVDLATLQRRLSWVGFELPFPVTGQLSANLRIDWPFGALTNRRAYRFQGTLNSRQLTIGQQQLRRLSARLDYRQGVLRLEHLRFQVPPLAGDDRANRPAELEGTGSLQVLPEGDLNLRLDLDGLSLAYLGRWFEGLAEFAPRGLASGSVTASVASSEIRDAQAWEAQGQLRLSDASLEDLPPLQGMVRASLDDNILTLNALSARMAGLRSTGNARLQLNGAFPFQLDVALAAPQLEATAPLIRVLLPDSNLTLTGGLTAKLNARGGLREDRATWEADGEVELIRAATSEMPPVDATAQLALRENTVRLTSLTANLAGLAARGNASVQLNEALTFQAQGSAEAADLHDIVPLLNWAAPDTPWEDAELAGRLSATVDASGSLQQGVASWQAQGQAQLQQASLHNLPPSDATADVTLRDNVLTLTSLTVVTTGLEATGKATMQLNEALDVQADAQVEAPDLAEIAPLLAGLSPAVSWDEAGLSGRIQATLTAQGSLQQGSASWQAQGQASLVQGTLYGLPPLDATANAILRENVLTLQQLKIEGSGVQGAGTANVHLAGAMPFEAQGQLDVVNLATLAPLLNANLSPDSTPASGKLLARLTAQGNLQQGLDSWQAEGSVQASGASLQNFPPLDGTANVVLHDSTLTLSSLDLDMAGMHASGTAQLQLSDEQWFEAHGEVTSEDLADAGVLLEWALERKGLSLAGELRGKLDSAGSLQQGVDSWRADGRAELAGVTVNQLPPFDARGQLGLADSILTLREMTVDWAGLRTVGAASMRVTGDLPFRAHGVIDVPDLAGLAPLLGTGDANAEAAGRPVSLSGQLSSRVAVEGRFRQGLSSWQGDGELNVVQASFADLPPLDVRSPISLRGGVLALPEVTIDAEGIRGAGRASLQLSEAFAFEAEGEVTVRELREATGPLLERAELGDDFTLSGQLRAVLALRGELRPWQWRILGGARIVDGLVGPLPIDDLAAQFHVQPDMLRLQNIRARLLGGGFTGNVQLATAADRGSSLQLNWQAIQLRLLHRSLPAEWRPDWLTSAVERAGPDALRGTITGRIDVSSDAADFSNVAAWQGQGDLRLEGIGIEPWLVDVRATWSLADGTLAVDSLQAQRGDSTVHLVGRIAVQDRFEYSVTLDPLSAHLADLPPQLLSLDPSLPLVGQIVARGTMQGTLDPLTVSGQATVQGRDILAGGARLDALDVQLDADADRIAISDMRLALYGGEVTGQGTIPLEAESAATFDVSFSNVDVGQAAVDVAQWSADVEGTANGQVQASVVLARAAERQAWTVSATLAIPQLLANGLTIGNVDAQFAQQAAETSFQASGQLFDGTFDIQGQMQTEATVDSSTPVARVTLRGLSVGRMIAALGPRSAIAGLDATIDATVVATGNPDPQQSPVLSGEVLASQVMWKTTLLTSRLQTRFGGTTDHWQLTDLQATLFGGQARAAVALDLGHGTGIPRATYRISARGMRLSQLTGTFAPGAGSEYQGTLDLELSGVMDSRVRGIGQIALQQAALGPVQARAIRSPLQVAFDPQSGHFEISATNARLQVAGGTVSGPIIVGWSQGWNVDGRLELTRLDVATLLRQLGLSEQTAQGRLTGRVTLKGSRMRSLADLSGSVQARFQETQALQLPVLRSLSPYVAGASSATRFGEGNMTAQMNRGIVHIEQLTLVSNAAQLYVEGTISLAGRLDLQAVVSTNQLDSNPTLAKWLLEQLSLAAAPPVALLMRVNEFLADRVIYLDIGGTYRTPVITVRPLPMLRDAAVRFFLEQSSLPVP